ncbi:MAG: hypothetical protein AAF802_17585 [Planctomycetota bacterium]
MNNPYKPTLETAENFPSDQLAARFRLTRKDLSYAKSKYLLRRYGGRLSLISLLMVGIAIATPLMLSAIRLPTVLPLWAAFLLGEFAVMILAVLIYRAAIWMPTKLTEVRLKELGLAHGAECEFWVAEERFHFSTPAGQFKQPLHTPWIRTSRGMIMEDPPGGFWMVPKRAAFSTETFRKFIRELRRTASS